MKKQRTDKTKNAGSLHIAMIGHKRVPSREGGVEIVVWELATRLRDMGYEVDCYNRSGYHMNAKSYDRVPGRSGVYRDEIRILTIPTVRNGKLNAIVYSVLATIRALFGRYDAIHFHAEGPCLMIWLPKLFHIRCVATIHGLDWQRAKWGNFASRMLKTGEKFAARYADEVIVLSRNVQEYFLETYGRKTHFIPNGIVRPEKVPAGETLKRYGLEPGHYFMTLSRLVPEKGLHYVIEALRGVDTDFRLAIVGGTSNAVEYDEQLQEMAEKDPRVVLTGMQQREAVAELLSNTYAFVLPSDIEGMSISLLEAMSFGCCCLVSDIRENTEVVENRALTFRKGDVSDLREKLIFLLQNPETVQRYRDEAADFICGKYNWDEVVRETLKLYQGDEPRRGE